MNALLHNWTFMRGLRLLLGVVVLIQSIVAKDLLLGAMSLFLIGMALFNFGCCGSNGCGTRFTNKKTNKTIEDVDFEEVVDKK
ncbi:MAG: hypothetical protein JNJ40_10310 [Bacteroidia bacterium]|nr:hypothetical protein [Bacteroidia bacterium]